MQREAKSLATLEALDAELARRVQGGIPFALSGMPITQDLSRFRRAEEVGNTYITVNGAIDPEAVSRQLVAIMNESDARGTVGAGGFRLNTQVA
jgi:hypothetical protein